jgi:hypothetical protein
MDNLRRSLLAFLTFSLVFPVFAQQPRVVVVDTTAKELKRSAHRLRIPVEQLKNARLVLQEATDLAESMDPFPADQISSLAQSWKNINKPKFQKTIDSIFQHLRAEAAEAPDGQTYTRATSAAMMLLQSTGGADYDRTIQTIRDWPEPPSTMGEAGATFRNSLESQAKSQALSRLAGTDPERALALLSQPKAPGSFNYALSGQIMQGLMNAGKKDEALRLADQIVGDFAQHASEPRAQQEYEAFLRISGRNLDPARANAAISQLIPSLLNQPQSPACSPNLKVGDKSVSLTCAESKVLNLLTSSGRAGTSAKSFDLVPGLKSKLDSAGGVDNFIQSVMYGNGSWSITSDSASGKGNLVNSAGSPSGNYPVQLSRELVGKAESDPEAVKEKIQNMAKGPEDVQNLLSLATMLAFQNPDLAGVALEHAQALLPKVAPLQKRAEVLQNLIRAYRQVDGEVDPELLKSGFVLADQMRQELQKNSIQQEPVGRQYGLSMPDRLETFLVSELSRDSFETAMRYARSLEKGGFKLACLIQIVQALSRSY